MDRTRSRAHALAAVIVAIASLSVAAGQAHAADRIYWVGTASNTISSANLDGSGAGTDLAVAGATVHAPFGLGIDPSRGTIYWTNFDRNTISVARLDGTGGHNLPITGATVNGPIGLNVDAEGNAIYWANYNANKISSARLDGSGAYDLDIPGATINRPSAVVINPFPEGEIFWTNAGANTISSGLNKEGGRDIDTSGVAVNAPFGLVVDDTTGGVDWANRGANTISSVSEAEGDAVNLDTTGVTVNQPIGVASDAGFTYWANHAGNTISVRRPFETPLARNLATTGATSVTPAFPVILKAPSIAPHIAGLVAFGSPLVCRPRVEPDYPGMSLYQAPRTTALQWLRNKQPLAGQITTKLPLTRSGSYACRATAANHAGTVTRTSPTVQITARARLASCPYRGTRVRATSGDDELRGGRRNDLISGRGGWDILHGGRGNDCLFGQDGDDGLYGGPGNDVLKDTGGSDSLDGGPGNDRLNARDRARADRGDRDNVRCGSGNDTAIIDRADRAYPDCEHVRRRR